MKQFSIRDLLFLVVIVALAFGWWMDRRPIPARYQMVADTNKYVYILDTATGQAWGSGQMQSILLRKVNDKLILHRAHGRGKIKSHYLIDQCLNIARPIFEMHSNSRHIQTGLLAKPPNFARQLWDPFPATIFA